MSRFLNPRYAALQAYVPGEQPRDMRYVKLNTNESPFPPSPEVLAAVNGAGLEKLRLYSDPECLALRQKLAGHYGVGPENVFVANGSDDILNFAFMAFAGGDVPAVFPDITYGFYKVFADLHGIKYRQIPLSDDFTIRVGDYAACNGFIAIANPNAPTGIALPAAELEEIVRSNPGCVVLIDEAYVDFGAESCLPLTKKYDNLLVVMTYSKSRSMAGARLGFAVGNSELISDLNKLKYSTNPYNVNSMTLACARAAIDSQSYFDGNCRVIEQTREYTARRLDKLGFRVLPSKANFLFAEKPGFDGETLYARLKEKGVLVRHFTAERIRNFNRITIGTREQMDVLLSAIEQILSEV